MCASQNGGECATACQQYFPSSPLPFSIPPKIPVEHLNVIPAGPLAEMSLTWVQRCCGFKVEQRWRKIVEIYVSWQGRGSPVRLQATTNLKDYHPVDVAD